MFTIWKSPSQVIPLSFNWCKVNRLNTCLRFPPCCCCPMFRIIIRCWPAICMGTCPPPPTVMSIPGCCCWGCCTWPTEKRSMFHNFTVENGNTPMFCLGYSDEKLPLAIVIVPPAIVRDPGADIDIGRFPPTICCCCSCCCCWMLLPCCIIPESIPIKKHSTEQFSSWKNNGRTSKLYN